jgi:hypothetical protein
MNRPRGFTFVAVLVSIVVGPVAGANAPVGRYKVGDGAVTDTETGLIWRQTEQPAGPWTWVDAQSQCSAPWRVPTVQELRTISDLTQATAPAIDTSAFYGPVVGSRPSAGWFWTSTVYRLTADGYSFYVNFDNGSVAADDPTQLGRVRCVQ